MKHNLHNSNQGGGRKTILYNDYNSYIPPNQQVIGTITTQIGNIALHHSYKLLIIQEQ